MGFSYVLFSAGPTRQDATCAYRDVSLPHTLAGLTSKNSERFFSSGNERTAFTLPLLGEKNVGYKISANDQFSMIVDLMNQNDEDKVVYLTMTWDFVPGHKAEWDDMKPIWLDIAQCGTSELNAPVQSGMLFPTSTKIPLTLPRVVLHQRHMGGEPEW